MREIRTKTKVCVLCIILFLAGCTGIPSLPTAQTETVIQGTQPAATNTASMTSKPSALSQEVSTGTPVSVPTSTATKKVTPSTIPTDIPSPTTEFIPTAISMDGIFDIIDERGELWLKHDTDSKYTVINFDDGTIKKINAVPEGCDGILLPNRTDVICKIEEQFYLYNLVSEEWTDINLPTGSTSLMDSSPLGDKIIYDIPDPVDPELKDAYIYDISKGIVELSILDLPSIPYGDIFLYDKTELLSSQGNYIAYLILNTPFSWDNLSSWEISTTNSKNEKWIVPVQTHLASGSFNWSPVEELAVFGTTDSPAEIGPSDAKQLWLADPKTQTTWLLSEAPTGEERSSYYSPFFVNYEWSETEFNTIFSSQMSEVWSLDGSYIAVPITVWFSDEHGYEYFSSFCIIEVKTGNQFCYEDQSFKPYSIYALTWSPSGRSIAFLYWDDFVDHSFAIYSLEKNEFYYKFDNNIEISNIYWR